MSEAATRPLVSGQLVRYIVNGVVATAVHYSALRVGLDVLHLPSAGLANFFGALFGIATSFAGSRYFVFQKSNEPIGRQAMRFVALYAVIALLHAGLLFVWTDLWHLNYNVGFGIAIVIQVIGSFFGNKYLVFTA